MRIKYIDLLIEIYDSVVITLTELFSHIFGYIMIVLLYILSTFGDKVQLFNYILLCMVIDLFWGMASNYVKGTFGLSKCFVRTAIKITIYLSLFTMCVLIEQVINGNISILTRTVSTILCGGELLSIIAHILIIKPNMPILKVLSKYLTKEMARKLKIQEGDIDELFTKE